MASSRPAAGGGRWVEVDPARLPRWLAGFRSRHGAASSQVQAGRLLLTGADGTVAEVFPPPGMATDATDAIDTADPTDPDAFVAAAQAPRRVGLLLARKGAAAVGISDGDKLLVSKVDSWYVQARTAAGGQSQQRFARRRGNQAAAAAGKATEIAVRILVPEAERLQAVVAGGDRRTVETICADPRLRRIAALRHERHLAVPTPNLAVLRQAVVDARVIMVHLPAAGN